MEDLPQPGMPTSTTLRRGGVGFAGSGEGASGVGQAGKAVLRDTVVKASTPERARGSAPTMFRNPLLLLLALAAALLGIGLLGIGAFPPSVTPAPVERVVPADRFGTR